MTTTQVVKTSITVNNNSPIKDYIHPDDHTQKLEHICRYGKQHSCFCKAVEVVEDFMGYALKEEVDLLGYSITFYLHVSINFCYYFFFQCQVPLSLWMEKCLSSPTTFYLESCFACVL